MGEFLLHAVKYSIPGGTMEFKQIAKFELDERQARNWGGKGLILLVASFPLFLLLPALLGKKLVWEFPWFILPLNLLLTAALLLLHELVHGLTIQVFGGRPRYSYGVKEGLPYLATTTDKLLGLRQYIIVALAPVILITLAGLIVIAYHPRTNLWLAFPLALHTSGAVGDLAMGKLLLTFPYNSFIKDDLTGFTVFAVRE